MSHGLKCWCQGGRCVQETEFLLRRFEHYNDWWWWAERCLTVGEWVETVNMPAGSEVKGHPTRCSKAWGHIQLGAVSVGRICRLWEDWLQWQPETTLLVPEEICSFLITRKVISFFWGFLRWHSGKESACNAQDIRDAGLIPGSGRSPEVENGNPFQYSCLENPMDRGAWRATVHGVPQSMGSQRVRHDLATQQYFTVLSLNNHFIIS